MLQSDLNNSQRLAEFLFVLTQGEGDSVEIHHPNPDDGPDDGPASTITVTRYFELDIPKKQFWGSSIIDYLQQAFKEYGGE